MITQMPDVLDGTVLPRGSGELRIAGKGRDAPKEDNRTAPVPAHVCMSDEMFPAIALNYFQSSAPSSKTALFYTLK